MKTRIITVLLTGLFVPALLVGTASAVEETQTTQTTNTNQQTSTTNAQATEAQKAALKERLQKRKDALKLKLTTLQQKRVQQRCKNSQGKITSELNKTKGIETSRSKVYSNLVDRLTKLEVKLAAKGVNTTELKTEIATLKTKIAIFNTDLTEYKQAVSDLAAMDCEADPTAFKSSLEAARTARKKVREDAKAVRSYVKDTIKPTLAAIRAQLDTNKTNSNNQGANN